MEARGVEAVRELLARSSGVGAGAVVRGLGDTVGDMPLRGYVEGWVARKEAEQQARERRAARINIAWAAAGVFVAVIATLLAFLSWRFPVK